MPRIELDGMIADFELEPRKLVLFCKKWMAGRMIEHIVSLHVEAGARIVSESQQWLRLEDLKVGQHVIVQYRLDQGNNIAHEIIIFKAQVSRHEFRA